MQVIILRKKLIYYKIYNNTKEVKVMINPASRTKSIELSLIRKMFEVTNPDAINLGIGEPDFDVPENIKNAMKK